MPDAPKSQSISARLIEAMPQGYRPLQPHRRCRILAEHVAFPDVPAQHLHVPVARRYDFRTRVAVLPVSWREMCKAEEPGSRDGA
jgi:hypothetical protein